MARVIRDTSGVIHRSHSAKYQIANVLGEDFTIRCNNWQQDMVVVEDVFIRDTYKLGELKERFSIETIVDVGAHIGTFGRLAKKLIPGCKVFSYECEPENYATLRKNLEPYGLPSPHKAAVTYEKEVALLNAVFPNCVTTGGSTVCSPAQLENVDKTQYWADSRPIETRTLEQVFQENKIDRIDVLKLDCEGSEFSILENTSSLDKVMTIVGEWHGRAKFMQLVESKFSAWDFRIIQDGELGLFWLTRVIWPEQKQNRWQL